MANRWYESRNPRRWASSIWQIEGRGLFRISLHLEIPPRSLSLFASPALRRRSVSLEAQPLIKGFLRAESPLPPSFLLVVSLSLSFTLSLYFLPVLLPPDRSLPPPPPASPPLPREDSPSTSARSLGATKETDDATLLG